MTNDAAAEDVFVRRSPVRDDAAGEELPQRTHERLLLLLLRSATAALELLAVKPCATDSQ